MDIVKNEEILAMDDNIEVKSREIFANGLLNFFVPCIEKLDGHVHAIRSNQTELRQMIDLIITDLNRIYSIQLQSPLNKLNQSGNELETRLKKLANSKRRIVLINNILSNTEERLQRLQTSIQNSIAKKKVIAQGLCEAK